MVVGDLGTRSKPQYVTKTVQIGIISFATTQVTIENPEISGESKGRLPNCKQFYSKNGN